MELEEAQKNIELFIQNQFGQNFRENASDFIQFMEFYYQWTGQSNNVVYETRSVTDLRDVDEIKIEFFDFLRNEFMQNIPKNSVVDEAILLKNIVDFYRAVGTEPAVQLLFRILYNEEIEFYYPGRDMLRLDAGNWIIDRTLEIESTQPASAFPELALIQGSLSGARALLDRYVERIENNRIVKEIFLSNISGTFRQGENILSSNTTLGTITSNGLITSSGTWLNSDGFLDSEKRIQDDFFYQEFSYVIRSTQPIKKYFDIVEEVVHPSGLQRFGSVQQLHTFNLSPNIANVDIIQIQTANGLILLNSSLIANLDHIPVQDIRFISAEQISNNKTFYVSQGTTNVFPTITTGDVINIIDNPNAYSNSHFITTTTERYLSIDIVYPFNSANAFFRLVDIP